MKKRILLFIPTYNCEKQIVRVFSKITPAVQAQVDEILVIDNRSHDKTLEAACAAAKTMSTKVTILRNKENYNLGGSIKRAFLYALSHEFDYMITLHGDDQADIRDFLPMLEECEYLNHDLIIGARFHPQSQLQGYSWVRTLGNRVLNLACALINRRRVYDMIAGINCYKVSFFEDQFFLKFPDNLTFDAHFLLYAFHKNANVRYIPVTWREEDQMSNAKVVQQALTVLKLFFNYVLHGERVFARNKSGRSKKFTYESELIEQICE